MKINELKLLRTNQRAPGGVSSSILHQKLLRGISSSIRTSLALEEVVKVELASFTGRQ